MNLNKTKLFKPIYRSWNLIEILLVSINLMVAIGLFIYAFFDTSFNLHDWKQVMIIICSLFANITNVMCFILIAKKKKSNYIWGIIAVILLGTVAFYYENTGTWIINWVFYIPTQTIGLIMWWKNANKSHDHIQAKSLKWWVILIICIVAVGAIIGLTYANSLESIQLFFYNEYVTNPQWINWVQFFCDAAVLVVSPIAMFLMMFRYRENLIFWIVVDVLLLLLWTVTLIVENDIASIQMIFSWGAVLLVVIYGQIYWKLDQKNN